LINRRLADEHELLIVPAREERESPTRRSLLFAKPQSAIPIVSFHLLKAAIPP
jgi:hypothetical protein